MMSILAVASLCTAPLVLAILISASRSLSTRLIFLVTVLTVAAFPRLVLTLVAGGQPGVGFAPANVILATYHVGILLAWVTLLARRDSRVRMPTGLLIGGLLLLTYTLFVWEGTIRQWSGTWQLSIAFLAWPIGVHVAAVAHESSELQRFVARTLLVVMILELLLGVLQLSGTALPTTLTAASAEVLSTSNRVTGTLGNPANLSKISFFFLLIGLPLTASKVSSVRHVALLLVVVSLVVTALTISRANLAAAATTLALWFLLAPRAVATGQRVLLLGGTGLVMLFLAGPTVQRYLADPEGSSRPELLQSAIQVIPAHWLFGLGVNSYVVVMQAKDSVVAATGLPVHNTAALLLVESGILVTVAILWVWILLGRDAIANARGAGGVHARLIVAATPGIILIGMTGYGLLSSFVFPMFVFLSGYLAQSMAREREAVAAGGGKEIGHERADARG